MRAINLARFYYYICNKKCKNFFVNLRKFIPIANRVYGKLLLYMIYNPIGWLIIANRVNRLMNKCIISSYT